MTKFILFMNVDMVVRNSAPEEFACIWQSKRVGIITIETEKKVNSLFHATFSWLWAVVVSFEDFLIFTQDVTNSSVNTCCKLKLVFKSVFSSRADSILNSDGDFNMSNWKFADRVHFFGAWTRQAVNETIAVVYQLTKRTQEKLFAYWAKKYKAFFVPNQEPASAWIFWNSSVKVGTQGLFCTYLKTFVPPFLPISEDGCY